MYKKKKKVEIKRGRSTKKSISRLNRTSKARKEAEKQLEKKKKEEEKSVEEIPSVENELITPSDEEAPEIKAKVNPPAGKNTIKKK